MKSLALLGISAFFLLSACGGDSGTASASAKSSSADMEVSTYDGLPTCAEKREGKTAYVKDQEQGYVCQNGKWVEDDEAVKVYPSSTSTSIVKQSVTEGSFTDSRDGKQYRTVTIGSQIWMAENLNYQNEGSYCYDDDPANCAKYGRLYEYEAAVNACPIGWYLPSKDEWWTLFDVVNKTYPDSATYSLWAKGFENWPQAFDAFGFSIVPAGIRTSKEDVDRGLGYRNLDEIAFFQVSEPSCDLFCKLVCIGDSCDLTFLANNNHETGLALSVRCLKDTFSSEGVTENQNSGESLLDSRDGKTYRTVEIGSQIWMAENLNYRIEGSDCYDDNSANCAKYGRLYSWTAAMVACPSGWHLPDTMEWRVLENTVRNYSNDEEILKKFRMRDEWPDSLGGGVDSYGFSALPSGVRASNATRDYLRIGEDCEFWTSLESSAQQARYVSMVHLGFAYDANGYYAVPYHGSFNKENEISVRCIKD